MSSSSSRSAVTIVDSEEAVRSLLEKITGLPVYPPSLYCDLEGVKLSRHGSISIFSLYVRPTQQAYLIDVHTLGAKAFDTATADNVSLRTILESTTIPKVFFDIRNDSDALFAHYKISVAEVKDLQLMELATRSFGKKFVAGLAKCIERDSSLSHAERTDWMQTKEDVTKLYAPESGGTYEVFNERPMRQVISQYCERDVALLPHLFDIYDAKLRKPGMSHWPGKVQAATLDRIEESQSAGYDPNSSFKTYAPGTW
ncbi:hypothetical protein NA57DRAFT_68961 [Rhizodiscina lignyota]|uniref:3'-5' exonuclease domain-containing protein n=1 Tax=Rhizodiscina lignyota TaxID=1504668 RepID=A0A9P4I8F9_9PEZI|nr:hypothetical protein NA57DRAFT_68961 [Rhizodiscina lignyota]